MNTKRKWYKRYTAAAATAVLLGTLAAFPTAFAQNATSKSSNGSPQAPTQTQGYGYGPGMMGCGYGPRMMRGY